jgi:hypothetical protein
MFLPGITQFIEVRNYRMTSVIPCYGRTKTVKLFPFIRNHKKHFLRFTIITNNIKNMFLRLAPDEEPVRLVDNLYNYGRRIVLQAHKYGPYLSFCTV